MLSYLVWACILLIIGLAVAVLEVFLPSGGILGLTALVAIVGSIVLAFMEGTVTGATFSLGVSVLLPVALVLAFKIWPKTPIGRRMLLETPQEDEEIDPRQQAMYDAVGKSGTAKSDMLPSGAVVVDGRTFDAHTEGMPIDAGQPIRVVGVEGFSLLVRAVEEDAQLQTQADDELSKPLDALGIDPDEGLLS